MEILRSYALSFLHRPYRWGGDDPISGLDCSGLTQEILASIGMDPPGDQTAQSLFDHFSHNGSYNSWGVGALAFYGKSAKEITHVGFCVDNYRMVEAGGGDSTTISLTEAIKRNAFVRIRLIKARKDLIAVIRPYYITRASG